MRSHNKIIVLLVLTPFVFSFAFGLDIYIPIIHAMQMVFNTTQAMVQLTLSLFILTNGIGQLVFGPISDRFGRFKVIVISGVLFTLGALLSALVRTIDLLILARIICALGTSGLFVVSFAIVRDIFSERESGMMLSFLNAAISISPTFAPIIGGYLAVAYGWTSVFWFLMGLGVMTMLLSLFCIRETHLKEKRIPLNLQVFKRYWQLFSNRHYLSYVLLAGWGVGICFSFFSVSPLIIIRLLQVPMEHFGYYFALFGIAIAVGGMLGGKVIHRFGPKCATYVGIVLMTIGGIAMLAGQSFLGLSLMWFMATTTIACMGAVFLIGAGAAGAMAPFAHMAGTAASGLGFVEFAVSAVVGSALMLFPVTSSNSYGIAIIIVSGLAVLTVWLLRD